MTPIVCTVLTGTKYSVDDVNKLYTSLLANTLCDFRFVCYTSYNDGFHPDIITIPIIGNKKKLQWYKTDFFKKSFFYDNGLVDRPEQETIIVMDIDLDVIGNVDFLFDPIKKDVFIGSHRWWWRWREDRNGEFALSGTVYKFNIGEFEYIAHIFDKDIEFWQEYFINNGITKGPVNGEQHYVQKMLMDRFCDVSAFPEKHIIKWNENDFYQQTKLQEHYKKWSGNDYIDNENGFHPDVRIIHYAGS